MKRIVVVASFSGDARDFLRVDLGVNDRETIIITPTMACGLEGLGGDSVERVYDVRRRAPIGLTTNERMDATLDRFFLRYPDVPYSVRHQ